MLKNIPATLSPDLLWCLASMGHAERLVLVDRNFPAHDVARHTSTGRLIELPGLDIPQAARAILSVMPLDDFIPDPVSRMQVVGDPAKLLPIFETVRQVVDAAEGPKPQTRFVLTKALKMGLRPILCINKVDRAHADPDRVHNAAFDLFAAIGATEEQLDFPHIYASGRAG